MAVTKEEGKAATLRYLLPSCLLCLLHGSLLEIADPRCAVFLGFELVSDTAFRRPHCSGRYAPVIDGFLKLRAWHSLSVGKQFKKELLRLFDLTLVLFGISSGKQLISRDVVCSDPFKALLIAQRKRKGLTGRGK